MTSADDLVPDAALQPGKLPGPLLDRLVEQYRTRADPSVLIVPGYGRDAAAIDTGGPDPIIVKSDPITFATESAARYLVAVNANDIACLGGIPRWFSVVLMLPEGVRRDEVEAMFAELRDACDAVGISVVGGHTEVTSAVTRPVFVGTMLGVAGPQGLLAPGGARPGDELLLTQAAGIEGTALLAMELRQSLSSALGEELVARAAALLSDPGISVATAARALLAAGGVTALHDPTEGGVATAIHELAATSGCGAEVWREAVPVRAETAAVCAHLGIDPFGLLGSGALLAAVSPGALHGIEAAAARAGVPLARIGRLVERAEGITIHDNRGRAPLRRFDADEVTRAL